MASLLSSIRNKSNSKTSRQRNSNDLGSSFSSTPSGSAQRTTKRNPSIGNMEKRISEALTSAELLKDMLDQATPEINGLLTDLHSQCQSQLKFLNEEANKAIDSGRSSDLGQLNSASEQITTQIKAYETWKAKQTTNRGTNDAPLPPSIVNGKIQTAAPRFQERPPSLVVPNPLAPSGSPSKDPSFDQSPFKDLQWGGNTHQFPSFDSEARNPEAVESEKKSIVPESSEVGDLNSEVADQVEGSRGVKTSIIEADGFEDLGFDEPDGFAPSSGENNILGRDLSFETNKDEFFGKEKQLSDGSPLSTSQHNLKKMDSVRSDFTKMNSIIDNSKNNSNIVDTKENDVKICKAAIAEVVDAGKLERVKDLEHKLESAELAVRPKIEAEITAELNATFNRKISDLIAEVNMLKKTKNGEESKSSELLNEKAELKNTLEKYEEELNIIKKNYTSKEKDLINAKDMWLKESSRASSLNEALTLAENKISKLTAQIDELTVKLQQSQSETAQLKRFAAHTHEDGTSSLMPLEDYNRFAKQDPPKNVLQELPPIRAPESSLTHEQYTNLNRFRTLLCCNDAVLFEDDIIQIGVKSLFEGISGKMGLYIGNKRSAELHAFSFTITTPPDLIIDIPPPPSTIPPHKQICIELEIQCDGPFTETPALEIRFLLSDNSSRIIHLNLPIALSKFTGPRDISKQNFYTLWKDEAFILSEVSCVCRLGPHLDSNMMRLANAVLLGDSLRFAHHVDPNPDNLVLVGVYPPDGTETSQESSVVLIRIQPSKNSGQDMKIIVRSRSCSVARAFRSLLVSQIAQPSYQKAIYN